MIGWIVIYTVAALAFMVFAFMGGNFIGSSIRKALFSREVPAPAGPVPSQPSILAGWAELAVKRMPGAGLVILTLTESSNQTRITISPGIARRTARDLLLAADEAEAAPATLPEAK